MLYSLLRPLLWLLDAERAHRLVLWGLHWLTRVPGATALLAAMCGKPDPILRVRAFGKELASPIGLAAGLDKDAEAFAAFAALGFGFVEVGTITAQAQPGNPKPRLFRLPADRALINRMGFNNDGAAHAARRLATSGARRACSASTSARARSCPPSTPSTTTCRARALSPRTPTTW